MQPYSKRAYDLSCRCRQCKLQGRPKDVRRIAKKQVRQAVKQGLKAWVREQS